MGKADRIKTILEAFPGLEVHLPQPLRVSDRVSVTVRGTKVLVTQPKDSDIIPTPG